MRLQAVIPLTLALTVAGCGQPATPADVGQGSQVAQEPLNSELLLANSSRVCDSAETAGGLKNLIVHAILREAEPPGTTKDDAIFQSGVTVSIEDATAQAIDPTLHKVDCQANIGVEFPPELSEVLEKAGRGGAGRMLRATYYSVEPSADGDGIVYSLEGYYVAEAADYGSSLMSIVDEIDQRQPSNAAENADENTANAAAQAVEGADNEASHASNVSTQGE